MTCALSPQLAAAVRDFDEARDVVRDVAMLPFPEAARILLDRSRGRPAQEASALMLALLSVLQEAQADAAASAVLVDSRPHAVAGSVRSFFRRRPQGGVLPALRSRCAGGEAPDGRVPPVTSESAPAQPAALGFSRRA